MSKYFDEKIIIHIFSLFTYYSLFKLEKTVITTPNKIELENISHHRIKNSVIKANQLLFILIFYWIVLHWRTWRTKKLSEVQHLNRTFSAQKNNWHKSIDTNHCSMKLLRLLSAYKRLFQLCSNKLGTGVKSQYDFSSRRHGTVKKDSFLRSVKDLTIYVNMNIYSWKLFIIWIINIVKYLVM